MDVGFDAGEGFGQVFFRHAGLWQGAQLLHGRDDDADEQIQDGKGGQDDERDEEGPRVGELLHNRAHDAHGPTFQCHNLEKGEQAASDRAEPVGKGCSEEVRGEHGGGVEEDGHDGEHAAESGDGVEKSGDHFAQARDHGEQAQHPQHAQGADDGPWSGAGDQGDGDDDEVENIPSAPPEESAESEQFADDLDDENGQAGFVDGDENCAPAGHEVSVGFESENHGVEEDDSDDEGNDARGFDPAGEIDPPWGYALVGEAGDELLFESDHDSEVFSHGLTRIKEDRERWSPAV